MIMDRRSFIAACVGLAAPISLSTTEATAATPKLVKVAGGLTNPWGLAFLPDGSMLVTERLGRLRRVTAAGAVSGPISGLPPNIFATGQGGLLDITLDPEFAKNRTIYFAFSEKRSASNSLSVGKGVLSADNKKLTNTKVIFRQNTLEPGSAHYGSRLVFDRSGYLFVTTGDRNILRKLAQDPKKHVGKILRITTTGAGAPGNPNKPGWAPEVWSIGHRNVQGACINPKTGQLWTAEHGAKGGDEINTPLAGKNHGWPVISYGTEYNGGKIGEGFAKKGMEQPAYYWDPSIAPAGMSFYTGTKYPGWLMHLFVCSLKGKHVARLVINHSTGRVTQYHKLFNDFARFRDIAQGPDGYFYVITDESAPKGGIYRMVV
jgi:aldose sugar dehydrogenase